MPPLYFILKIPYSFLFEKKCVNVPYQLNSELGKAHSRASSRASFDLAPRVSKHALPTRARHKTPFYKNYFNNLSNTLHTHAHNVKATSFQMSKMVSTAFCKSPTQNCHLSQLTCIQQFHPSPFATILHTHRTRQTAELGKLASHPHNSDHHNIGELPPPQCAH